MSQKQNIIYLGDLDCDVGTDDGLETIIFNAMKQGGDEVFQIDALTGHKDTYSEALSRMVRTAITLRKKGVRRGDIVAICDYNHLNTCVPLFATLFLGATATAADHKLILEDMTKLLKKLKAKFIFTSSQGEKTVEKAIKDAKVDTQIVVFDKSTYDNLKFDEFLNVNPKEEKTFKPIKTEDLKVETALILFSSGSTGLPKGICHSHYGVLTQLRTKDLEYFASKLRVLNSYGIYWIGDVMVYMKIIMTKGSLVIAPQFDENFAWNWIEKYKVTVFMTSSIEARKMIKREDFKDADTSFLQSMILYGTKVPEILMRELKTKLPRVLITQGWGMTETCGRGLYFTPEDVSHLSTKEACASIGKPTKGMWYKVVDINTENALGPNEKGELRVKSDTMMQGYFAMDSSDFFDGDGFLKTGDLMYYDENLCFYYVERIGEMFKYRYQYVHPNNVEEAFLSHPDVKLAVVVGLPHSEDMMQPAAMVVLNRPGCIRPEQLREYVERKFNFRISLEGGVHIVKDLYKATSGKIKRREIQKILIEKQRHQ